jgi:hypothetical protein
MKRSLAMATALAPPNPELEKFRDNLLKGMAAKHMSGSDVARAVWGVKTDARGKQVARNRDRMTHYLAGRGYPRPETVLKLAEVLGLDPKDLEREPGKAAIPPPFVWGDAGPSPASGQQPASEGTGAPVPSPSRTPGTSAFRFDVQTLGRVHFHYDKLVDMRLAIRLFDAIRAIDPEFHDLGPGPVPDGKPPED